MKARVLWPFAAAVAFVVVLLNATLYEVDAGQYAVVTTFGRIVQSRVAPGLHAKIPFAQDAHIFNARLLNLRVEPQALLTKGRKQVLVDAFVEYRIASFRRYLTSTGGSRHKAEERIREAAVTEFRQFFGQRTLAQILTGKDLASLTEQLNAQVARYGLVIADLRIQRIGLGDRVVGAIDKRMASDQLIRAARIEARAMAKAQMARGQADRKRAKILAEAYEKAGIIHGRAQARAAAIYAKAYDHNPRFFLFYKSLRAYVQSFANRRTTLVIGPDSGFLRFLKNQGPYEK
ncbi:protease modulator HflC [Acidiferrobacter sp.]|jgi:membrane protease subunit HflC|uniref:protease modulator HflC n=3 Tax=Acidiferrobacter sp. TaxID=1872107 RepID=UPI00261F7430|nr:protease modulator HflC [Acidiferrobacter sp.]